MSDQPSESIPPSKESSPAKPESLLSAKPFYHRRDFWVGFISWYVLNGIAWGIIVMTNPISVDPRAPDWARLAALGSNVFVLPVNLVVLIVAAFVRRRFAAGILAAVALNLALSVLSGALIQGVCAIPFFIR